MWLSVCANRLLDAILAVTNSEYGFILLLKDDPQPGKRFLQGQRDDKLMSMLNAVATRSCGSHECRLVA